jgi:hypothetical protein
LAVDDGIHQGNLDGEPGNTLEALNHTSKSIVRAYRNTHAAIDAFILDNFGFLMLYPDGLGGASLDAVSASDAFIQGKGNGMVVGRHVRSLL